MESNSLTGIERELVLQYLIDGNVPLTITPIEEDVSVDNDNKIKPASSAILIKSIVLLLNCLSSNATYQVTLL